MKKESKSLLKYILLILLCICSLVLAVFSILFMQEVNRNMVAESKKIQEQISLNSQKLDELKESLVELQSKTDSGFAVIQHQNEQLISHAITTQGTANRQYRKTLEIEKTYSNLLEEERKTRIDSSELDLSIEAKKKDVQKYFDKKEYSDALKNCREILQVNPSDNQIRLYKMLSLFYMNRMDSTNYSEILNDIKILKENAVTDERINEAEQFIKQEFNQE